MKTYEEFLNIFKKKEVPKPTIDPKEKLKNFLETTDVEDIIYALHSITDELGKPGGIEYYITLEGDRNAYTHKFRLFEENNKFIPKTYQGEPIDIIRDINKFIYENFDIYFEIEFLFYENQNYDFTTSSLPFGSDSPKADENYEILKDFMDRIKEDYKFEESDFQYRNKGLSLLFKF